MENTNCAEKLLWKCFLIEIVLGDWIPGFGMMSLNGIPLHAGSLILSINHLVTLVIEHEDTKLVNYETSAWLKCI